MAANIVRNYRPKDLEALVALINQSDAVDKLDRATTLVEMEHKMSFPTMRPQTDCFLALVGNRLVGYAQLYARPGDGHADSTIHCWGVVHPRWRRRGLGGRLLKRAYRWATDYLPAIGKGAVRFQCNARDLEQDRRALFESFGLQPVRYWVNLVRSFNDDLPPVALPPGIRLRTLDPERDVEAVWRVDNAAFRDHWNHTESSFEEFQHWMQHPNLRPELWFLAEDEATGEVVGLGLNEIKPDRIARNGRQEGYVDTVAVLRAYRRRGVGTALLAQSLQALRKAGMDAADLDADAENLTGAMRIYKRLGFRVRKTTVTYQRVMREG